MIIAFLLRFQVSDSRFQHELLRPVPIKENLKELVSAPGDDLCDGPFAESAVSDPQSN